jgi:hypothetical protein
MPAQFASFFGQSIKVIPSTRPPVHPSTRPPVHPSTSQMNHPSVSRRTVLTAGLLCTALIAACEDKRVKELKTGISRDSAVNVIKQDAKPAQVSGTPTDSFPNVYTREQYLINGQNLDILYFTPDNAKAKVLPFGRSPSRKEDSIPFKRLTPLVFVNNKLVGRGWDYWDSVSKANKIPLKPR